MTTLYRIRALVRWLFRRDEIERALDTDLEDYVERSAAEKVRAGMSAAEARRAARIELGGIEQTKDSVRATLSFAPIDHTLADLGFALRTLGRQKTFTGVAVLTLALGIGVNVAIFSLAEQILLRPLPVPEPDRLVNLVDPGVELKTTARMDPALPAQGGESVSGGLETIFSYPMFRDLEREQQPFVGLAAHRFFEANIAADEQSQRATGALVSGSYFPVLGLRPALGRLLGPEDDRIDGQADSVVLSYAYWENELGGDPDALGRTLTVNDVPLTIVGVAPEGFHGTARGARASVFVPITISFAGDLPPPVASTLVPNHDLRNFYWAHLFGRLKPGVAREDASAVLNTLHRAILSEAEAPRLIEVDDEEREAFRTRPLVLEPGARGQTTNEVLTPARDGLVLLLAVSAVVLLLCCANVAGLVLVRGTARSGEMAVRATMGATHARLASLLCVESLVLALPAAILSLPVAWLTLRGAVQVPGIPEAAPQVSSSVGATFVAIGLAVASAAAFGLLPIRSLTRVDPGRTLQAYGARQTTAKGVTRFRAGLATAQIALSMALLAVAGVLAQSLANIARLDLGVEVGSVVMFAVETRGAERGLAARIEDAVEAIPGVSSVATSQRPVLSLERIMYGAAVEGMEATELRVAGHMVSADLFRTLGIELLAGRDFNLADLDRGFGRTAIVNRRFVERLGLAPDAVIGRRLHWAIGARTYDGEPIRPEIVGVVADTRPGPAEVEPEVFHPLAGGTFYVRGTQSPGELMSAVRQAVTGVAPTKAVMNLQTLEEQFRENVAIQRFFTGTSTAFAVLATALAALGLYGVLAYSVAQRSREIGLRVALGAPTDRIRGMVLRQVTRMAVVGIALGAVAAWLLGFASRRLLFGVEAGDPLALAAAAAILTAVVLGAAYLPARGASRVDPISVLRHE